jgi:hypothetical protein
LARGIRKCPDENWRQKIIHAAHPFIGSHYNLCLEQLVADGFKTKLVNRT